jgi:hypothetical protein
MELDEEGLEDKYLEFLGDVEKSFSRLDISASSMMARLYCGLRFTEGCIRALKVFKMFRGEELLDEVGRDSLISWLEEMIQDLKKP